MACEGYFDKMDDEAALQRIAAYRIHQSLVQKPLSIDKFWKLRSDVSEEVTFEQPTKEWWDEMMVKQKAIDAKIKRQAKNN